MIALAKQLIARQKGQYEPADIEDRYEARLREVIAAKLKGAGIAPIEDEEPDRSNEAKSPWPRRSVAAAIWSAICSPYSPWSTSRKTPIGVGS